MYNYGGTTLSDIGRTWLADGFQHVIQTAVVQVGCVAELIGCTATCFDGVRTAAIDTKALECGCCRKKVGYDHISLLAVDFRRTLLS